MPITPELAQYVAQARQTGLSDEAIREALFKAGWSLEDINTAVPVSVPVAAPTPMPTVPPVVLPVSQSTIQAQQAQPIAAQPAIGAEPSSTLATPARRRSRMPFIVTVVILLLIGGAVYYFLPQIVWLAAKYTGNEQWLADTPVIPLMNVEGSVDTDADQSLQQSIAAATEGWQTYRNEKYGFEFKYSARLMATSSDVDLVELWSAGGLQASKNVGEGFPDLLVTIEQNPGRLEFQQWFDSYDPGGHIEPTRNIVLNSNLSAYLAKPGVDAGIGNCCEVVFLPSPSRTFFVKFVADSFDSGDNMILSSFKFISQATSTSP